MNKIEIIFKKGTENSKLLIIKYRKQEKNSQKFQMPKKWDFLDGALVGAGSLKPSRTNKSAKSLCV
jgi:hypothetical protein